MMKTKRRLALFVLVLAFCLSCIGSITVLPELRKGHPREYNHLPLLLGLLAMRHKEQRECNGV